MGRIVVTEFVSLDGVVEDPGGSDEPRGSRPARIESRSEVSICRCSGIRASRSSTTRTPELVLTLLTGLVLTVRTDSCQGRPVAANPVKEHTVRRIINSARISPDGVIQDPQDWPGNSIEPDLHLGVLQ